MKKIQNSDKFEDSSFRVKENFVNIIFFLCFFPFFKLLPFLSAEIQPFSAVFSGVYLLFFKKYRNQPIYKITLPYILVILCYFIIGIIMSIYHLLQLSQCIESLLIFISPLLIFIALFEQLEIVSVSVFRFAFYAWFILSFCQFYFPALLNATKVSLVLNFLISRFSAEKLADWGRGVSGFSPEPSYGAHIILLILVFGIFIYRQGKISRIELAIIVFSFLFMVYANQSATMGFMIVIFVAAYIFFKFFEGNIKTKLWILYTVFISIVILFSIINLPIITEIRLFKILLDFFLSISGENIQSFDPLEFTNSLGSMRTLSIQVGYLNALQTYGIGSGMGGWGTYFIDSMEQSGINPLNIIFFQNMGLSNIKPYAYASLVAFDLGLIGLISVSIIFFKLVIYKIRNSRRVSAYAWSCLVVSIFALYTNSPTSLPVYWIFFLIFIEDDFHNNKKCLFKKNKH